MKENTMTTNTQLKSINTKAVCGNLSKKLIGKSIMTVYGFVSSTFEKATAYGTHTGLKGDLVAVNSETGEIFTSNAGFLPASLTSHIVKMLEAGNVNVEFKADIRLAESKVSPMGYAVIAEEPMTEERLNNQSRLIELAKTQKTLQIAN